MSNHMENMSFNDMWESASGRSEKITNQKLDLDSKVSLDDCLKKIQDAQSPGEDRGRRDAPKKRDKWKQHGLSTLRCLKLLGGVVAEGAGMVFQPSNVCFSALSILLDVPQKAHDFWENVDSLLQTLWPSLSEFQIYQDMKQFDKIERQLKEVVHGLMISFVDICALCVSLQQFVDICALCVSLQQSSKLHFVKNCIVQICGKLRRRKVRREERSSKLTKFGITIKHIAWNDDSGVAEQIKNFESLTTRHNSIKATITLKAVLENKDDVVRILDMASETGSNVGKILQTIQKRDDARNASEKRRAQLEEIKSALSIADQLKRSADVGKALSNQRIPRTAEWFENEDKHPEYAKWADHKNSEARPVLLVTGGQNTGKSILLSSIARSLHSANASFNNSSMPTWVSPYFFQTSTGKDDQEKRPIETAIKSIAYLMAEQDELYAKNLFQVLQSPNAEKHLNNATTKEMWDLLDIGSSKRRLTHYIILDGIESLSNTFHKVREDLFEVLASSISDRPIEKGHTPLRVAISTKAIPSAMSSRDLVLNIEIQEHSSNDMEAFINQELKDNDLFQDHGGYSLAMTKNIRERLVSGVKGNFTKAKTSIERIQRVAEADEPNPDSEIDAILQDLNKKEGTISGTVVRQLQERLSGAEVNELNGLLIWVIYGYVYFEVDELEAALSLRGNKRRILPLIKKIESKYAPIIKLDPSRYAKVDDDMADSIIAPRVAQGRTDQPTKFDVSITITQGEMSMVQNFLWSLAQKLNHENMGFQQLSHRADIKGTIRVNPYDGHMAIVHSALTLLANEPSEQTKAVAGYLLQYLPRHLEELKTAEGPDALTEDEKTYIGSGIYNLVYTDVLERHWASCGEVLWYGDAKDVTVFRRWLNDAMATSKLGQRDREWLEEIESESNPNQALLENIMKRVAVRWLQNVDGDALKPYQWLRGYLAMPQTSLNQEEFPEASTGEVLPDENGELSVEKVATWCSQVLGVETEDAIWHQRLGETFEMLELNDNGVKAFNRALELGGSEKVCFEGLARCFAQSKKLRDACVQMENALRIMEMENDPDQLKIISTCLKLADWYKQLGLPEMVAKHTMHSISVMENVPENADLQLKTLSICLRSQQDDPARRILHQLLRLGDDHKPHSSTLRKVVGDMSSNVDDTKDRDLHFLRCFVLLKENSVALECFLNTFHDILELREAVVHEAALLLYKGVGLHHFSYREEPARLEWRKCFEMSMEQGNTVEQDQAAMLLSAAYFECTKETEEADHRRMVDGMKWLVERESLLNESAPRTYLASYFMVRGERSAAQELLRPRVESAFDLLSDEFDYNDATAYYSLGCILTQLGDDANALTAFSLRLPSTSNFDRFAYLMDFEQESTKTTCTELMKRLRASCPKYYPLDWQIGRALQILEDLQSESLAYPTPNVIKMDDYERLKEELEQWRGKTYVGGGTSCDNCARLFGSDADFYHCRCCHRMDLCNDCLQILQKGEILSSSLKSLACKKSHTWLLLPRWDRDDFRRSLSGNVIKGGTFGEDGRRVGGEEKPAQKWLDDLKREWGWVRPEAHLGLENEASHHGEALENEE